MSKEINDLVDEITRWCVARLMPRGINIQDVIITGMSKTIQPIETIQNEFVFKNEIEEYQVIKIRAKFEVNGCSVINLRSSDSRLVPFVEGNFILEKQQDLSLNFYAFKLLLGNCPKLYGANRFSFHFNNNDIPQIEESLLAGYLNNKSDFERYFQELIIQN